jgi:drug/metabolite transporter (DMT)-like permease
MFLGFFAWYSGLARAGIARASQLQLAQPFLTIGIASVVLGERPTLLTYVAAAIVLACLLLAQRARFEHSRVPLDLVETMVQVSGRDEISSPMSRHR